MASNGQKVWEKEKGENQNRTKEIEKTNEGETCEEMEGGKSGGKKRVKRTWRVGGQGKKRTEGKD